MIVYYNAYSCLKSVVFMRLKTEKIEIIKEVECVRGKQNNGSKK